MPKRSIILFSSLFAVALLVYLPVIQAGFIWDDDAHLTAPALRTLSGLWRIWTDVGATQQYYPLLHSLFWVEYHLWGDAALGYHLMNVCLHATCACLFAVVLQRVLSGRMFAGGSRRLEADSTRPRKMPDGQPRDVGCYRSTAFLAAALFAVHPVHTESVAWISEQKNTLSLAFYLGAALIYLRFDEERRRAQYFLALALFTLGLLSKTVTATLPGALLVVSWWQRGRLDGKRDVLPLLPWLLLGLLAGVFTAWVERTHIGAEGSDFDLSPLERLLLAGCVIWFYLGKLLWPANLTFIYPRWEIDAADPAQWLPLVAACLCGGALWLARHRSRAPLASCLFFVGSLFPVLGFFNVYPFRYSFVADHFQYIPSLGVLALTGAGLSWIAERVLLRPRGLSLALLSVLLAGLGTLTWRQSRTYRDAETLYRATIDRNPACWMAYNNLGKELMSDPHSQEEAIACFEKALEIRPDYHEASNNLGLVLTQVGRPAEAVLHLEQALRLKGGVYQVHNNLGIALAGAGRLEEAVAAFSEAARLNPRLPNLEENLAKALVLLGRKEEAEAHFRRAEQLRAGQPASARP